MLDFVATIVNHPVNRYWTVCDLQSMFADEVDELGHYGGAEF